MVALWLSACADKPENALLFQQLQRQLDQSNRIIEQENIRLERELQLMLYRRSKTAAEIRGSVLNIVNLCDTFLSATRITQQTADFSHDRFSSLYVQYQQIFDSLRLFQNAEKDWRSNHYHIHQHKFSYRNKQHFATVLPLMENDILITKRQLIDYLLFYSLCRIRPSHFIHIEPETQLITTDSTMLYHISLHTAVPFTPDSVSKSLVIDNFTRNGKIFERNYTFNSSTMQLFFDSLPYGNYRIEGYLQVSRQNNISTTLPFGFDFVVK